MQKFKVDKKTIFYFSFYIILILDLTILLPQQARGFIRLHSKIKTLKKNINQFNQDANFEDKLREERDTIKNFDIPSLEGKIITSQDIFTVSAYISNKAKENTVDIVEIFPRKPEAYKTTSEGEFFYLPIEVEAKAGFHNLAQFINTLEEGYYFLETKELRLKESSPYHEVSLVIVALLRE